MLGLNFRWTWKVRRARKKWDRLREKALKKRGPLKDKALKQLDDINSNLTMMEETQLSWVDRARISKDVEISLEEVKALLKLKRIEE